MATSMPASACTRRNCRQDVLPRRASIYLMNVYGDTTGTALLTEPEIAEFREETVPAMLAILAEKDLPETDPVEHLVALAPGLDQPRGPRLGQMLGTPGCRFAHRLGELVDRPLPSRRAPQQAQSGGVGKHSAHLHRHVHLLRLGRRMSLRLGPAWRRSTLHESGSSLSAEGSCTC